MAQALTEWSERGIKETTWVDLVSLKEKFHRALAWVQASSSGEGGAGDKTQAMGHDKLGLSPQTTRKLSSWLASHD